MKLATFLRAGQSEPEIGLVEGSDLYPAIDDGSSDRLDMKTLISNWSTLREQLKLWKIDGRQLKLQSVRLLAPVLNPSKIMAIGLNYGDHVAESGLPTPAQQIWFAKMANTINGPYDPIMLPTFSTQVDYEVELVAIIGKHAKKISLESAPEYIFGYCVGNDVTMRDWQLKTPQWLLGKSGDTHGPFGPFITTSDELDDPHNLDIMLHVNGQLRQRSNTRHLIFNVYQQLVELF